MDEKIDYKQDRDFKDFQEFMAQGLNKGAEQYGPNGFLKNDVMTMMEEEIRDLACYAFMLYKKVKLMRIHLLKEYKEERRANPDR